MNSSLTPVSLPDTVARLASERAEQRYLENNRSIAAGIDQTFAVLMCVQWIVEIATALWITPRTWIGATSSLHIHVWGATFIGAAISLPVIYLALVQPGARLNRYVISVSQALTSALLIHLTGGRLETHFHIFGSLAFIALYRDWRVLIPATIVVALDHLLRGVFWPESVFGIDSPSSWRWLEHAGWVLFEDAVLIIACVRAQREMRQMATQWANLSVTKELVDMEVQRQVTELAVGAQRLQESELRARRIINTANEAYIAIGASGKIAEWSQRAEALLGWSSTEAIGRDVRELLGVTELWNQLSAASVTTMLQKQTGQRLETTAFHRHGGLVPVEASISALSFGDEQTVNVFFHDISKRKAMQTQLLHAQKMQGIGQLAAGIAHEINTPAQFAGDNMRFLLDSFRDIDGMLARLDDEPGVEPPSPVEWSDWRQAAASADLHYLRGEIPTAIEQAIDGVQRIAQITRAMKEFSNSGAVAKQLVDPRQIIENSVTVSRNEWKYVAELTTEHDLELNEISCLPSELSHVLVSLIINSAQAIGDNPNRPADQPGRISIQTKKAGEWVSISVQDNGPGIPPEIRGRIFEPFFTTKEVGKGSGQGLATAHAVIVEKHGGTISVASEIGQGTTVTLRLPLIETATAGAPQHEADLVC